MNKLHTGGVIRRAFKGIESGLMAFSNAFNAAAHDPVRTTTMGMPIDSRRELTFRSRIELVKKSRWLRNNLGIYRRFIDGSARYAIGAGVVHIPDTGDQDYDKILDEYFDNWASNEIICDVRGKLPFWRLQRKLAGSMMADGDGFVLKVGNGTNVDGSPGLPQLQWLEPTYVSNLLNLYSMNGFDEDGFREGIKQTPFGKVTAYKILQDRDPQLFDLMGDPLVVPADAMRHVFNTDRATGFRGLPWAYHGMNSALDIMDIVAFEKAAVKLHSSLSGAIKKKSGDAGKGGFTQDLTKFPIPSISQDNQQRVVTFENFAGGAGVLQLSLDEEFQLYSSSRPQQTFGAFIDFLIRDMAWGFGVSPEFMWAVAKMSGPNSRIILEDSNGFFEDIQDMMVFQLCRPIYTWVISRAILRKEIPEPPAKATWWGCHWQGPAKVTIDEGRLGALELSRLQSGCMTWEQYWGGRGKSGRKMVHSRIDEIADAMAYAKKLNVPFEYVITQKPGTPTSVRSDQATAD